MIQFTKHYSTSIQEALLSVSAIYQALLSVSTIQQALLPVDEVLLKRGRTSPTLPLIQQAISPVLGIQYEALQASAPTLVSQR